MIAAWALLLLLVLAVLKRCAGTRGLAKIVFLLRTRFRRRLFNRDLQLILDNQHIMYIPTVEDLYIKVISRPPSSAVIRAYFALRCKNLKLFNEEHNTFISFPEGVCTPINGGGDRHPHASLVYDQQVSFANYEEYFVKALAMEGRLRQLIRPMWMQLQLSTTGRALRVRNTCEFYAFLRLLQAEVPGAGEHTDMHFSLTQVASDELMQREHRYQHANDDGEGDDDDGDDFLSATSSLA